MDGAEAWYKKLTGVRLTVLASVVESLRLKTLAMGGLGD
jgi:hypothetical protein